MRVAISASIVGGVGGGMGAEVTSWCFGCWCFGGGVAAAVSLYACGWGRKRTWTYVAWLGRVLAWDELLGYCPFGLADAYIRWC